MRAGLSTWSLWAPVALSLGLALPACSKSRVAPRASPTSQPPGLPELRAPVVDEQAFIEGSRWAVPDAAGGFEVLSEFEPLAVDADDPPPSDYVGRAGTALYFRSQAGELWRAPLEGGPRSLVAKSVPEGVLFTGDAREVYWLTSSCELFAPPARRIGACVGSPHFVAVDVDAILVVASSQPNAGPTETQVWRIPRAGGEAERRALPALAPFSPLFFDGERLYYERSDHTLMSWPKTMERPAPFARQESGRRVERVHFADGRSLFYTARLASDDSYDQDQLIRADQHGGAPRVIATGCAGTVTGNDTSLYWLDASFNVLRSAPRAGGEWRAISQLPPGEFELLAQPDGLLAWDGRSLLRVRANAPAPTRLHQTETSLEYLTQADHDLYVVATPVEAVPSLRSELWQLPKRGGTPRSLLRDELRSAPAVDRQNIYYRSQLGLSVARNGAAPRALVPVSALAGFAPRPSLRGFDHREPSASSVALDATQVYWLEPERGVVLRVAKTGGPASALARLDEAPQLLALDATHVYFCTAGSPEHPARLYRVAKSGRTAPEKLAELERDATSLRIGQHHAWLADGVELARVPKRGGAVEALREGICDVDLTSAAAFFTDCSSRGAVWRLGLADGKLDTLATSLTAPRYVAADERGVYFITIGVNEHPMSSTFGCCSIWTAKSEP